MNSAFGITTDESSVVILRYQGELPSPVDLGFIGRGVLDEPLPLPQARERIEKRFPGYALVLPNQTHGETIVFPKHGNESDDCEGDAISIELDQARKVVACIRTADCVPLLLVSKTRVSLVHAGWRGLANGIISKTVATFPPAESVLALIGPCAGGDRYQIGREVIEAIGSDAVYHERQGDLWLDTALTAEAILRRSNPRVSSIVSGICTIGDPQFHSFRRDGDRSGRNISFIAIS